MSKTRCVQSLEENFTVFIAAFVPAFSTAFASAFPAALISAAAAFPTISVSAFAFAG
jgi:hypothetical protein